MAATEAQQCMLVVSNRAMDDVCFMGREVVVRKYEEIALESTFADMAVETSTDFPPVDAFVSYKEIGHKCFAIKKTKSLSTEDSSRSYSNCNKQVRFRENVVVRTFTRTQKKMKRHLWWSKDEISSNRAEDKMSLYTEKSVHSYVRACTRSYQQVCSEKRISCTNMQELAEGVEQGYRGFEFTLPADQELRRKEIRSMNCSIRNVYRRSLSSRVAYTDVWRSVRVHSTKLSSSSRHWASVMGALDEHAALLLRE